MTTTFKEKQEIQRLKKLDYTVTDISKKLKITRSTVYKYLEKPPPETIESETEALCPNCNKPLKFVNSDKQVRCPNYNKLFNIIRENDNDENDNDDKEQKERDTPYKYSTEIPRRRWRGINLRQYR